MKDSREDVVWNLKETKPILKAAGLKGRRRDTCFLGAKVGLGSSQI